MKTMKKTLATILALAMTTAVIGMTVSAADPLDPQDGIADVTFEAGDSGITDPDDLTGLTSSDISFGTVTITAGPMALASSNAATADLALAGFGITDLRGENDGWNVSVNISEFERAVGDSTETTMGGFVMGLTPTGLLSSLDDAATITATAPQSLTVNNLIATTPGNDNTKRIFTADAGKGMGIWGDNWAGTIDVAGSNVKDGAATATMTWTVAWGPSIEG